MKHNELNDDAIDKLQSEIDKMVNELKEIDVTINVADIVSKHILESKRMEVLNSIQDLSDKIDELLDTPEDNDAETIISTNTDIDKFSFKKDYDFNAIKFRPSRAGDLMVSPKSKSESISETTKQYLCEYFVETFFNVSKDIMNKYINKGIEVEWRSVELYKRYVRNIDIELNQSIFSNDYLIGKPDIILNDRIVDTKSSWDLFSYFKVGVNKLNKDYYWQLQCYMELLDKQIGELAYCLVDTPDYMINDEKKRLLFKMNVATDYDESYIKASNELERKLKFESYIPYTVRVRRIMFGYDEQNIESLYKQINIAREWMKNEYQDIVSKCNGQG